MSETPLSVEQIARRLAAQKLGEAELAACDLHAQLLAERQAHAQALKDIETAAALPDATVTNLIKPGGA